MKRSEAGASGSQTEFTEIQMTVESVKDDLSWIIHLSLESLCFYEVL